MSHNDLRWMQHALTLAQRAQEHNEVPVGCVIVQEDKIIGEGWNQPILNQDATAHAEIVAIKQAGQHINNYRLINSALYVTLEPCLMCLGAMIHARIARLVFGAFDPKTGVVTSHQIYDQTYFLNHRFEITAGVLADQCGAMLKDFFKSKR